MKHERILEIIEQEKRCALCLEGSCEECEKCAERGKYSEVSNRELERAYNAAIEALKAQAPQGQGA